MYRRKGKRQKLTWRKLGVLIDHLPPESATITAMRVAMDEDDLTGQIKAADPSKGAWSPDQMLLATLIDEVRSLQHITVALKVGKKAGDAPEPMPRPGVAKKGTQRRSRLRDEQRQFFESLGGGLRLVQPGETASEEPQGA